MPALSPGTIAPDFSLEGTDGKKHQLEAERQSKLVVAAFFKKECPICQLTVPFLEKIHGAYKDAPVEMLGIAENDAEEAKRFASEYGLTFPVALDDHPYSVSAKYRLTNVPSIFLIDHDGKILQTMVGFDKQGLIDLSKEIAQRTGLPAAPVFTKKDDVPDYKPG
ncbi:MAG: TlpA disulfide reductase family protein [Acidobacteriia bacterium]|nr:TlpA disulfide reductase family protein [Terriglobia bacterium]